MENEANFNLVVHVRKRLAPITINVKGRGFTMNAELGYQQAPGEPVIPLSHKKVNDINFGETEIQEHAQRVFTLVNTGRYGLEYNWEMAPNASPTVSVLGEELGYLRTRDVSGGKRV